MIFKPFVSHFCLSCNYLSQLIANRDYKEISTTLQFSPQVTERIIVVEALRDVFFEDVEMFFIQLSLVNPGTQRGVIISEKEASVNITDQNSKRNSVIRISVCS